MECLSSLEFPYVSVRLVCRVKTVEEGGLICRVEGDRARRRGEVGGDAGVSFNPEAWPVVTRDMSMIYSE